jgi:two-component system chemotaxis response regulator CheY
MVLETDPRELAFIQQVLDGNRHTLIPITSSEQAWGPVQTGEVRFLMANWDTSDIKQAQFIPRVRASKLPTPFYILLSTAKSPDEDLGPVQADDMLHKPYKPQELKNRVAMGERIISLASNLANARSQLESQAVFDTLTGFMNRAAFLRQSAGELERVRRASAPLSLISLEVENFKNLIDVYGTEVAEDVLGVVSQTIREKSRPYDYISRWTENEFLILVSGVIGVDAEKIAERIIAGVRSTHIEVQNETPLNLKISAGIASVARISASTEVEPLIEQSRRAMARAKEAGGNQVFLAYV